MTEPGFVPPGDSPTGPGGVSGAWQNVRAMPRWQIYLALAVVLGGAYYYYAYRNKNSSSSGQDDPATQWESNARSLLLARGYPASEVDSALNHYLRGGNMTPGDIALISVAISSLGTPDVPNAEPQANPPNPWSNPGPGAPFANDTTTSGPSSNISSSASSYWTVQSAGFGWTSSMNGIAQQFYGSTSQATQLLQANPGVVDSVYGRIPIGTKVRVPRLAAQ